MTMYKDFMKAELTKAFVGEVEYLMHADFSDDELEKLGYNSSLVTTAHQEVAHKAQDHRKAVRYE